MEVPETAEVSVDLARRPFRMSVQWVKRPNLPGGEGVPVTAEALGQGRGEPIGQRRVPAPGRRQPEGFDLLALHVRCAGARTSPKVGRASATGGAEGVTLSVPVVRSLEPECAAASTFTARVDAASKP